MIYGCLLSKMTHGPSSLGQPKQMKRVNILERLYILEADIMLHCLLTNNGKYCICLVAPVLRVVSSVLSNEELCLSLLGNFNDLWSFSIQNQTWEWVSGVPGPNYLPGTVTLLEALPRNLFLTGHYGTLGQPSEHSVPGARDSAITFVDGAGSLWLFGGTSAWSCKQ